MVRTIGWFLFIVIILIFMNIAVSEPVSSWHPSARDYFQNQDSGRVINNSMHPIIPPVSREVNKIPPASNSSSALRTESQGNSLSSDPGSSTRILVRYNASEVSSLADASIEGVTLVEDLGTAVSALDAYGVRISPDPFLAPSAPIHVVHSSSCSLSCSGALATMDSN